MAVLALWYLLFGCFCGVILMQAYPLIDAARVYRLPLIMTFIEYQKAFDLTELTDAKGAPVGIASVQYKPGSGHPVLLSYYPRFGPQQGNAQPTASVRHGATSHERVAYTIPIQQGSNPTQAQLGIANVPALKQPRAIQTAQVIQKQNDNTFRFAQMGSGGQFTLAPTIEGTPTKGKPLSMKTAGAKYEEKDPLIMCFIDQQSAQITRIEENEAALLVAFQPTMTIPQASSQSIAQEASHCLEDSPTADLAGDSPRMPNSCQSESVAESGDATSKNSTTFDDPSLILTPAALSMHEEMLRAQQKKIEKLLEELAKSQAHLKQEQQLILCAKKAQVPTLFGELTAYAEWF
ncbi:unnamed protein product [Haemonchus placei]|uniref:DUF4774 domain-containing protein n=1 Tax=Haemonchus placei TaxID=6290 RepID=A0A0N4WZ87_HAEPC|nr:unnamed protein product [Haemonchus placei]